MVARHFLCCLPLRLGALLISFCQLVLVGLFAAGGWYAITALRGHLPTHLKGFIFAMALYYTILALAALVGLLGTLWRKAGLLSTYAFYLSWSIGVQIVIDAAYLWAFFSQSREKLIERCIDGSTDQHIQDICNNSFNTSKWSLVGSMVGGLIIQIWAAYIVSSYAKKLKDEKAWRSGPGVGVVHPPAGPKYTHVKPDEHDSHIPLTGASYSYPYNDAGHSFGYVALETSIIREKRT
ncbi:hypothetical protein BC826DRAFT_969518 [Russula brevipes]|nr:hypothetical protein BC826DRAFT_969518 [Russula brevipes]